MTQEPSTIFWVNFKLDPWNNYLTVIVAPVVSSLALSSAASSLETPSLRIAGALSTMSLASFKPRPVTSRTALITATLFAPKEVNSTLNSDCSSTAAAAAAGPADTAAADTLNFSSKAEISSTSSRTVFSATAFRIYSFVKAMRVTPNGY